MIATGKYKGHTEDIERWQMMARSLPAWANDKDEQLVRDVPLLLEQVKRLREENDKLHAQRVQISWIQEARGGQSKAFELLAEVERLRKDRDLLWDAIRLSGTGAYREEEIAFWHEKLLNMNEAELKEAFKEHYEDD